MSTTEKIPATIAGHKVKVYDFDVNHRGESNTLTHYVSEMAGNINGIEVTVIRHGPTGAWWITPNDTAQEEHIEDFGPYDTVEDAVLHFKLMTDPC